MPMTKSETQREEMVKIAIEIAVKLGVLGIILYVSYLIVKPFLGIVLWAAIIAVAIAPLVESLAKRLGSRKLVIWGITGVVIAALLLPTYMLSDSMINSTQKLVTVMQEGKFTIPPPTEKVKEWPLIGEKSYVVWKSASENLRETLAPFQDQIKKMASSLVSALGSGIGTIFMFVVSMIIAAFMLLGSEGAVRFYKNISRRLMGEKGEEWADLSALTVRSVATGVIGVAVIQATLALIGLMLMGVPFAPVIAVAILFLTIIQMPALIVIAPVIAYVFSQGSGTAEMVFAVYMLIVGASDGILKPMLMGRGVDIPMLVILIGAIGGMMLMGMIGLFIGAVIFALSYKLFDLWVSEARSDGATDAPPATKEA
jgi:predicted PurR-regulated permease PerM